MPKKLTQEEFILYSNKLHNNKYDYSDTVYINTRTKVKIKCDTHGIFLQTPRNHLQGQGCKKCYKDSKFLTQEEFIQNAINVHGDNFGYDDVIYINNVSKVKIKCPTHGLFLQSPKSHLSGQGCKKCNNIGMIREKFISLAKDKDCKFYVIKCFNDQEEFYKIGITTQKLNYRFSGDKMPYQYEVIKEIKSDAETIWNIENSLKENLKSFYTPHITFGGSYGECFTDLKEIENNFNLILDNYV